MRKKTETPLEIVIQLAEERKQLVENVDRLQSMRGLDDKQQSKCTTVNFSTSYGAAMHSHGRDPEFNMLMVETALTYYNARLENINMLFSMAATVLQKSMGSDLQKFLSGEFNVTEG